MSDKPRILVVDDEVKNVKLLEALLTPSGFSIEKAYNGQEALDRVARNRPDAILLDVMMPLVDGFEVCRRLKNSPETQFIPIVIMTALGQVEDRIKGKEAGADDFLTKPVDRRELLARINSLLRLSQAMTKKVATLEQIQQRLSHFVPSSVAERVAANPSDTDFHQKQEDVSVLFVDIAGYTRLSEVLPKEQVNMLVETLFSCFMDCFHSHRGEIGSTAGDGLMVIFHSEDPAEHALRSIQAALDLVKITEEMEREPASLNFSDVRREPLSIHVGIHSGPALVGPTKLEGANATRWVYTAMGPVVNLASRVGAFAQGGMIVVSDETARRVNGRVQLKDLGAQHFKNVAQPIPVFQVLAEIKNSSESETVPSII
jgi:adenylate cyclase